MRSYSQWIRDRRFVQSLGNQSASGFSELTPEAALGPVNDFASFIVFLNDMFLQDEFYTNLGMQTSMLVSGRLGSGAQFEVKRLKLDGGWAVRTSSDPHSRLSTGDSVILKKPHLLRDDEGRFSETNTIKSIVNELRILSHVPLRAHHNILDVFGIAWQPAAETSFGRVWPLVAVEYAPFGTLRRYLTSRKEQTYHARLKLVQDIAQGLQALHNCGIIHSDLKPDNVLVCKDKEGNPIAKISDFGHSIILSETDPYITWNKGTPLWMAPEWGQRVQARLLSFADIYSLGLILWSVMLDGLEPWEIDDFGEKGSREMRFTATKKDEKTLTNIAGNSITTNLAGLEDRHSMDLITNILPSMMRSVPTERSLEPLLRPRNPSNEGDEQIIENKASATNAEKSLKGHRRKLFTDFHKLVDLPGPVQKQLLTALESLSEDRAQPEWRKAEASWAAAVFYILRLGTVRPIDSDDLSKGMTGYSLNADAVLSHLERAADLGYVPAQAAYRRVAAAIGQPPSESDKTWAKVKRWLVNATKNGSRVASTDLRWIDFDCWREADRTFRSDYCGIGEEAFSAEDRQHYPLEDLNTLKENLLINRRWELGDTAGLRCLAALNVRGDTLLHWSAMAGADAAMALLLNDFSESIDINQRNYHDETPLLCACRSGHYKIAKRLLAAGADAGMPNDVEENALHFLGSFLEPDNAVIEIARDLVGAGAAIDQVAVASSIPQAYASAAHAAGTPLQRATANEERKAITALLELKADPWSGERKSPIEMSCTLHSYEILRQFLQYPIRQPEWVARSVVEPEGLLEILQCLFIEQRSFQLGAPNAFARLTDMQDRQSLLGHAVRPELQHLRMFLHGGDLKRNLEQTLLVLQSSAEQDWSRVDSFGTNALMHAVGSRDVDLVQHLLSRYFAEVCPSLVTPTPSGYGVYLPIHIAVGTQVKPIFDILLDLTGLDSVVSPPRVPGLEFLEEWMETSSGYTIATLPANTEIASIVHLCATHSDDIYFCGRILESLEDTTDFVNRKGVRGETPFSVAVTNNFFAVADLLLAHGADIDLECGPSKTMKVTYTALGCVLRLNNDSTHAAVRYLLSRGASFIVNRQMGLSAIQCSCTSNLAYDLDPIATEELFTYKWDTKNLEILLKHFSGTQFLDHKDELQDETALHMAVKNGNLDAVKMLLEAGASPTVCKTFADGQEISPVDYAFVMAQGGYVLPPIKAKGDVAVDKFKGRAREIWSTLTNCEWSDSVLE